jgi:hypothetical protein
MALKPTGRKQPLQKKIFCPLKKGIKNWNFFHPGEHSLQVSAKSIKGHGCGIEWVNNQKIVKHLLCLRSKGGRVLSIPAGSIAPMYLAPVVCFRPSLSFKSKTVGKC